MAALVGTQVGRRGGNDAAGWVRWSDFLILTVVMAVVCGVFSDDAEDVGVLINFLLMV